MPKSKINEKEIALKFCADNNIAPTNPETAFEEIIRIQFEKVFLGGSDFTCRRNEKGGYVIASIEDAWIGWLAGCKHTMFAEIQQNG